MAEKKTKRKDFAKNYEGYRRSVRNSIGERTRAASPGPPPNPHNNNPVQRALSMPRGQLRAKIESLQAQGNNLGRSNVRRDSDFPRPTNRNAGPGSDDFYDKLSAIARRRLSRIRGR